MWIKIKFEDINEKTIILPNELKKMLKPSSQLVFGSRCSEINVTYSEELSYSKNSSFENPAAVLLSNDLKECLLIPDAGLYQAKIHKSIFLLGPVIAFLLDSDNHVYSPKHMEKYTDRFGIYNKVGGLIYAFCPDSIVWAENKVYGLYFNIKTNTWKYGAFPLPDVIYRRDFHQAQRIINCLKKTTHGRLFNSYRFSKLELFNILEQNRKLVKNLPVTKQVESFGELKLFINTHKKVILKPNNLSRGRGIYIIKKKHDIYIVNDYSSKEIAYIILEGDKEFLQFYNRHLELHQDYLVQKYIELAQIHDAPFDIRIVMQKKTKRKWIISGIECRVAGRESLITNISKGGYAMMLDSALFAAFRNKKNVSRLTKQIYKYCQNVCKCLDKTGEHYAELGIDIGIGPGQKIWLFEANVFPSFKGFKQMDYDTYLNIRYTPLLYASYLAGLSDNY